MDLDTLVEYRLRDGSALLARLAADGIAVLAAAWVKREDRWQLYLARPIDEPMGTLAAYREVDRVLRAIDAADFTTNEITQIGPNHPVTRDLLRLRQHGRGSLIRARQVAIGGEMADEVFVYPPIERRADSTMTAEHRALLERLFDAAGRPVEELPYTDELEDIRNEFVLRTGLAWDTPEVFRAIKNLHRDPAAIAPPGGSR